MYLVVHDPATSRYLKLPVLNELADVTPYPLGLVAPPPAQVNGLHLNKPA